jgi:hypothetical protein
MELEAPPISAALADAADAAAATALVALPQPAATGAGKTTTAHDDVQQCPSLFYADVV